MSKLISIITAAAITIVLSTSVNAVTIPLTGSGSVQSITDPDDLLFTDLVLTVEVNDAFTAHYTIDDSDSCGPVLGGNVYTCNSTSFSYSADFGNGGNVTNTNQTYRITIFNDFTHECLGTGDVWAISAMIAGPFNEGTNEEYIQLLSIIFIDYDERHSNTNLYFNDTFDGWDIVGIEIGTYYGDDEPDRGTVLLSSLPSCEPPTITISVDIKPGSDPNSINLCSNGAVPVAILGSDTFNVSNVNTDTLRFAEAAVKVVGKKDPHTLCSYEDVSGDYIDDLVCHYVTTDIAGVNGESSTATVNGELLDGTPIQGTDGVNIVKDTCN